MMKKLSLQQIKDRCPHHRGATCGLIDDYLGWTHCAGNGFCTSCLDAGGPDSEASKQMRQNLSDAVISAVKRNNRINEKVRKALLERHNHDRPLVHDYERLKRREEGNPPGAVPSPRPDGADLWWPCAQCKGRRVILVGNGPSATSRKMGHIIDSFDEVIRFNDFKTEGYEEYVGSKTTIWATFVQAVSRKNPPCSKVIVGVKQSSLKTQTDAVRRMRSQGYDCIQVPPGVFKSTWKELKSYEGIGGPPNKKYPSTGLLVIDFLLMDLPYVWVWGFDHFKDSLKGGKYNEAGHHYWKDGNKRGSHHHGVEARWFAGKGDRVKRLGGRYG